MGTHQALKIVAAFSLTSACVLGSPAALASGLTAPASVTVHGRVLAGQSGSRAIVQIFAQPQVVTGSHLRIGQHLRWTKVASAVSSPDGSFTVAIRSTSVLRRFANPGGIVNLDAVATTGRRYGLYGFSLNAAKPGRQTVAAHVRLLAAVHQPAVAAWLPSRRGPAPAVACTTPQLIKKYKPHWAVVGETSIRISGGETQQFTYQHDQNSSLGVGISGSNGFTQSGTFTIGSTSSIPFKTYGDHVTKLYKTEFRYGLYSTGCAVFTQPYDYFGGAKVLTVQPPKATHCAFYAAGSSPVFATSKAATYSDGITINEIGFTATAQTGWDSSASITYTMGKHGHDICGSAGPPGDSPQRLVVGRS